MTVGRAPRAPPPIHVDVGDSPGWRSAHCILAAAAVGVALIWWTQRLVAADGAIGWGSSAPTRPRLAFLPLALQWAGWGLGAVSAGWTGLAQWQRLARKAGRSPRRRLCWDGVTWSLRVVGEAAWLPGTAALVLDLGGWMLVRFRADAAEAGRTTRWVALRSRDDPAGWCALRAALWNWRAESRPPR